MVNPYYQHQQKCSGLITRASLHVRKKMFESLMRIVRPNPETTVLDVGVTAYDREECNFFEKLYPYSNKITVIGMEDAHCLEKHYPGLTFIKINGPKYPFPDKSFDLVVSFATIEHVGGRIQQQNFVNELCRVGRVCCITTPNRWYPIEFHTLLPFFHWLPARKFRSICRLLGRNFYAKEENLNLLSMNNMLSFLPPDCEGSIECFRLFGLVSNIMFYIKNEK